MAGLLRNIAIVGGGFCGTAVAANLLRRPPPGPTRVVLIERAASIGRGVAYAERGFPYLLNVPASRMSANSAVPDEFLTFAQRRIPHAQGADFLPRSLYGEYLQEALLAAELSAPGNVRLEVVHDEVSEIRRIERHLPLELTLGNGRKLVADDVVLATGNPQPATPAVVQSIRDHPAYVADPWARQLKLQPAEQVLLIGSGLTAADVINAASSDPQRMPTMHALSRHGLVAPRQTPFRPDAFKGDGNALLLAASTSLGGLTRAVRLLADEAERCGGDWREAITFVRDMAPTIWQRLPQEDRVRFLRHLRAYWDVHRHRLPPELARRLDTLVNTGRLVVHAGRIQECVGRGDRIDVSWRPRGQEDVRTQTFDRVVNCTGPDYAVANSDQPLWRSLLQRGLCVSDSLGLGLRTGPRGAVIDADGWPGPHLFYVGPMLRADLWEATAVQELRSHAEHLAQWLSTERG